MAGDWIKYVKGLSRKPEVACIAATLNVDRRLVVGCLMELWDWADDNTDDGHVDGVGGSFIDELFGVEGFFDALVQVNWARKRANGITIPNFTRHNGNSAKRRALDAQRKRGVRKPSASKAEETRTREEKRREEKKSASADPPKPPARNPWWDAIAARFYPSGVPPSQRKAVGRIVADLKAIGADPNEIKRRADCLLAEWGKSKCTARSLVNHWDRYPPGWTPEPSQQRGGSPSDRTAQQRSEKRRRDFDEPDTPLPSLV